MRPAESKRRARARRAARAIVRSSDPLGGVLASAGYVRRCLRATLRGLREQDAMYAQYEAGDDNTDDLDDTDPADRDCTFCGGDGFTDEPDDPINDYSADGFYPCSACRGTGLREHQVVF